MQVNNKSDDYNILFNREEEDIESNAFLVLYAVCILPPSPPKNTVDYCHNKLFETTLIISFYQNLVISRLKMNRKQRSETGKYNCDNSV